MASKWHRPITARFTAARNRPTVQQEIEDFLRALNSYPASFARKPRLSFEQHLFSIKASNRAASAEAKTEA